MLYAIISSLRHSFALVLYAIMLRVLHMACLVVGFKPFSILIPEWEPRVNLITGPTPRKT